MSSVFLFHSFQALWYTHIRVRTANYSGRRRQTHGFFRVFLAARFRKITPTAHGYKYSVRRRGVTGGKRKANGSHSVVGAHRKTVLADRRGYPHDVEREVSDAFRKRNGRTRAGIHSFVENDVG